MRIIDKNTDFYDYLQNIYIDKSIVFDRTDSFLLTKDIVCDRIGLVDNQNSYKFVLLQVCNTFWLFLMEILERTNWGKPTKYKIDLIATWDDYSKERCLIKMDFIQFSLSVSSALSTEWFYGKYDKDKIMKNSDVLIQAIRTNDYEAVSNLCGYTIHHGDGIKTHKHIPILKACGVADYIDPLEIFLAFEKYFILEEAAGERTESIGLTNNDKITNHGFDQKKSFRNVK